VKEDPLKAHIWNAKQIGQNADVRGVTGARVPQRRPRLRLAGLVLLDAPAEGDILLAVVGDVAGHGREAAAEPRWPDTLRDDVIAVACGEACRAY